MWPTGRADRGRVLHATSPKEEPDADGAGGRGGPFRKEGDVAKTHFVILLFSPLTATDLGERKERETRQIRTPKDEARGGRGKAKLAHFRASAAAAGCLGVSVM